MIFQIKLHPKAIEELTESFQWYEERSEGLGSRFIASVNKRMDELALQPDKFAKTKGNFREVATDVFPYIIIYEILLKKRIVLVSYIFHTKRNPTLKYKR